MYRCGSSKSAWKGTWLTPLHSVFGSTPQASKFLPGEVARRHIRSSIQPRPLANYDHARGLTFRIPFFEIIAGTTANENQERHYEEKTADVENKQWVPGVLFGDKDHRHIRYGVCTVRAMLLFRALEVMILTTSRFQQQLMHFMFQYLTGRALF